MRRRPAEGPAVEANERTYTRSCTACLLTPALCLVRSELDGTDRAGLRQREIQVMVASMLDWREHLKVLGAIVEFVVIPMMDVLVRSKRPSQLALHH